MSRHEGDFGKYNCWPFCPLADYVLNPAVNNRSGVEVRLKRDLGSLGVSLEIRAFGYEEVLKLLLTTVPSEAVANCEMLTNRFGAVTIDGYESAGGRDNCPFTGVPITTTVRKLKLHS
ncbi:MAG: hypothetical protein WCT01_00690 [Candidatus Shapirobacteria bacterium]|jgi:hypothetical protein